LIKGVTPRLFIHWEMESVPRKGEEAKKSGERGKGSKLLGEGKQKRNNLKMTILKRIHEVSEKRKVEGEVEKPKGAEEQVTLRLTIRKSKKRVKWKKGRGILPRILARG